MDVPNGILYVGVKERFPLYLTTINSKNPVIALPKLQVENNFPSEYQDDYFNLASRFHKTLDSQGKLTQTRSAQHEIRLRHQSRFDSGPIHALQIEDNTLWIRSKKC